MRLLITGISHIENKSLLSLEKIGFEVEYIKHENRKLNIDLSVFDCVVCNNLFSYNNITKFSNLKFVFFLSAGLDRAPIEYLNDNNIVYKNARGVYSIPIAEWVILKTLEIYKQSKFFFNQQNNQNWEKNRNLLELNKKTVCIIGYGDIGKNVAIRFKAFNTKIIGVDIKDPKDELLNAFYRIKDLDVALSLSDVIILSLPLYESTKHLINKKRIGSMKQNCVLINVSRGALINETDLIEALNSDKFLGVALDVFEEEPVLHSNELWNYEKLLITPHNSFVSENNHERMDRLIYESLSNYIKFK